MSPIRELYIKVLKETLDYMVEDIDDIQLFSMVSLLANQAERNAHARREKSLHAEIQLQQEALRNSCTPNPQLSGVGAPRHG